MRKNFCRNRNAILAAKMFVLFSGFTLFTNFLPAQTKIQKSNNSEKPPIALKLSIAKPKKCLGEKSIKLEVEMVNTGNKSLTIDKAALWKSYDVTYFKKGVPDGLWLRREDEFDRKYGDYILLAPNQKYNESHEFTFIDLNNERNHFFDTSGRYEIEMKYKVEEFHKALPEIARTIYINEIISNKTSFYIKKCHSK